MPDKDPVETLPPDTGGGGLPPTLPPKPTIDNEPDAVPGPDAAAPSTACAPTDDPNQTLPPSTDHDPYRTLPPSTEGSPTPPDPNQTVSHSDIRPVKPEEIAWPEPEGESLPAVPGHEILGVLGKGGMGVVYKARQKELDRLVALKMIRDAQLANEDDLNRFQAEARAIANLQHPNIIQIYDVGRCGDLPYCSLEYVEGGSLAQKMGRVPQPPRWSAVTMETLARAMHYAHERGIIHRDLKPANVLVTTDDVPKITDFGLAKQLDAAGDQTRTGAIMGTPQYMAPEQASGKTHELGPHSDQWSLGIILYEMLTGRVPYVGETVMDTLTLIRTTDPVPPRRLQPKLPPDLETICLKALQHDPARRYASAGAMADDLRRWLDGEPILARPVSRWEKGIKWARRRPGAALASAFAVLLVVLVIGAVMLHLRNVAQKAQFELTELQRLEDQRVRATLQINQAEELLNAAESVPANQRRPDDDVWNRARGLLTSAVNLVGDEPRLTGARDQAEKLLRRVQAGLDQQAEQQKTETALKEFARYQNVARFYNSGFTGLDLPENARKVREAAQAAVDLFGWAKDADPAMLQKNPYLAEADRVQLHDDGSGLLLVLAQETLRDAKAGAAKKALALLDQAARLRPPGPAHCLLRADCQAALGEAAAAERERQNAARLLQQMQQKERRGNASDYFLLALRQYQERNLNGAIGHFDSVLREQSGDFWALFYLGICYLRTDRPGEAKASLSACVNDKPQFKWNYLLRGLAYGELAAQRRARGDAVEADRCFDAAEKDFARALELKPTEDEQYVLLVNRGVTRFYQKDWDGAVADLEAAIRLKPDRFQAYDNLAHVHRERKEYGKALALLDQAIALKPSALSALYRTRAKVNQLKDDPVAALADLDRALAAEPADSPFRAADHVERGQVLHRLKRHAEALADCNAALKLQPQLASAHQLRAVTLTHLQRYSEAVLAFDHYLENQRGRVPPEVFEVRGLAQQLLGNYSGAIDDYTRALALKDDPRLRRERGWAYLVNEVPRLALRDFQLAVEQAPKNSDAYNGRGFAQVKLGHHAAAVKDAEEAVRLAPKDPRTLYDAARICAQAVARMDEQKGPRTPQTADQRLQYQERALTLLRDALTVLPGAREREAFWHDYPRRDPALAPLRQTPAFLQMVREYGTKAKDALPAGKTPAK